MVAALSAAGAAPAGALDERPCDFLPIGAEGATLDAPGPDTHAECVAELLVGRRTATGDEFVGVFTVTIDHESWGDIEGVYRKVSQGGAPIDLGDEGAFVTSTTPTGRPFYGAYFLKGPYSVAVEHTVMDPDFFEEDTARTRALTEALARAIDAMMDDAGVGTSAPGEPATSPSSGGDGSGFPVGPAAAAAAAAAAAGTAVVVGRRRPRFRRSDGWPDCDEVAAAYSGAGARMSALREEFDARYGPRLAELHGGVDPRRAQIPPATYHTIEERWRLQDDLIGLMAEVWLLSKSGALVVGGGAALYEYWQKLRQAQAAEALAVGVAAPEAVPPALVVAACFIVVTCLQEDLEGMVGEATTGPKVRELQARAAELEQRIRRLLGIEAGLAEEFERLAGYRRRLVEQYDADHARTQAQMDAIAEDAHRQWTLLTGRCGRDNTPYEAPQVLPKEALDDPIDEGDTFKMGRLRDQYRQAQVVPHYPRPRPPMGAH